MNDTPNESLVAYLLFKSVPPNIPWLDVNSYLEKNGFSNFTVSDVKESEESTTFTFVDYAIAAVMKMDLPYPQDELENRCESTWWWTDAAKETKEHTSHRIVALTGGQGSPLEKHRHLTALVAALLSCTDAIAVMWNGVVLQSAKDFLETAQESFNDELNIPLHLWVDFQMFQPEEGLYNLFTWGLESFGVPDMEVHKAEQDPSALLEMLNMVAIYCVENSVVFEDGESFGFEEGQRLLVNYGTSEIDPEKEVVIIDTGDVVLQTIGEEQ